MRTNPQVIDGLLAWLGNLGPIAVLLLIPAGLATGGTWVWTAGLGFVAVYGAILLASNVGLAVLRPAHFKVRQQGVVARREQKQPLIDAVGSAVLIVYWFAWLGFIPLDVFALHLLPRPAAGVSVAGGAVALLGATLTNLAIWQNQFAAPNVQDQIGAGQRVIDTGVYGLIRHPIYTGNLLLFGGLPLWLGSYAAFVGAAVILLATIGRVLVEEAQLRASLPGYVEYARRVRARFIPFLL